MKSHIWSSPTSQKNFVVLLIHLFNPRLHHFAFSHLIIGIRLQLTKHLFVLAALFSSRIFFLRPTQRRQALACCGAMALGARDVVGGVTYVSRGLRPQTLVA